MSAHQSFLITGRVALDPEITYYENSTKATVKIPWDSPFAKSGADGKKPTTWFRIEFWGKTADVVAQYVQKGSTIGVTGTMENEQWTDKNTGEVKSIWKVRGDKLTLVSRPQDSQGSAGNANYEDEPPPF